MKYQFSIRVYIKATRITPFIMPRDGIYTCNWSESGICNFEGIENGYAELRAKLDEYFHLDQPMEDNLIEYYDRMAETLMGIGSQADFVTALMHSAQTYSPFSLVVKVNAPRREEHWYNGESVAFERSWRMAKPKFACIRSWLLNLEQEGAVCKDILSSCSYSEKAFLYSQFHKSSGFSTNHCKIPLKLHQSNSPKSGLASLKRGEVVFELLDENNLQQKMLNEKMMMDPAISLILFNEYIPLASSSSKKETTVSGKKESELCDKMEGLFLGKNEQTSRLPDEASSESAGGLFIRSEPMTEPTEQKTSNSGGLFIRSDEATTSDDWVIA